MAVDMWSIGVTFLTMATKKICLFGKDEEEMLKCIIRFVIYPRYVLNVLLRV